MSGVNIYLGSCYEYGGPQDYRTHGGSPTTATTVGPPAVFGVWRSDHHETTALPGSRFLLRRRSTTGLNMLAVQMPAPQSIYKAESSF